MEVSGRSLEDPDLPKPALSLELEEDVILPSATQKLTVSPLSQPVAQFLTEDMESDEDGSLCDGMEDLEDRDKTIDEKEQSFQEALVRFQREKAKAVNVSKTFVFGKSLVIFEDFEQERSRRDGTRAVQVTTGSNFPVSRQSFFLFLLLVIVYPVVCLCFCSAGVLTSGACNLPIVGWAIRVIDRPGVAGAVLPTA